MRRLAPMALGLLLISCGRGQQIAASTSVVASTVPSTSAPASSVPATTALASTVPVTTAINADRKSTRLNSSH